MFNEIKGVMSEFISATLSNPRQRGKSKISIRPIQAKDKVVYQVTTQEGTKAIHQNLKVDLWDFIEAALKEYKQAIIQTQSADFHILMNRKNEPTVLKKSPAKTELKLQHNISKQYLIPEGTPVPYLVKLGVMNSEGKVLAKKYDKFRQINRFLEFIRDILPALPKDRPLQIIDFGCGKAYLTFALYHYLTSLEYEVKIHGLDLKKDVVEHCQALAKEFGFKGLSFSIGDIKGYDPKGHVDLVVTLHACDTATDAAIYQAVKWGAEVILSVPCCQHELYGQVKNPALDSVLRHGILKERFAALATDAMRADALEAVGYKTQILEFIDLAHTPKNLLIRAIKGKPNLEAKKRYQGFKQFLSTNPSIEKILEL